MVRHFSDVLVQRSTDSILGRADDMSVLFRALDDDGPLVQFIHGIAGVGKSTLLNAFSVQARAKGATVVQLDCRAIEPTERGFIHGLGAAIGGNTPTLKQVANRLGSLGDRVVLTLDTYEVFRLMDTWLRQVFVPELGDNVRVIVCGREPPGTGWRASHYWQGSFHSLPLGPLDEKEALELLSRADISEADARRINRYTRSHPLALKLAISAVSERPDLDLEDVAIPRVVEELTRIYLADVDDPVTRKALNAASVVRRTTESLLRAMLPDVSPQDAYERLRDLPFVESARDGLMVHESVQEAIAAELRAADPSTHRDYRRAAWHQLREESRTVGVQEHWRYTADMLYIFENSAVREGFFPVGAQHYAVEPARVDDGASIKEIIERYEGPTVAKQLIDLWAGAPESFYIARDSEGGVAGFSCVFNPADISPTLLQNDLVSQKWVDHLKHYPMPRNQHALFFRRWLSLDHGEMPSPVQAAFWLDVKRSYMALRPNLRRCYFTVCDLPTYAPVMRTVGIQPLPEADINLDGTGYHTAMLDLGPASVDGWLAGLVAAELGVEQDDILDIDAHELVLDEGRIHLTPLEFGVMQHLYQRKGSPVARATLITDIWDHDYDGGSNVVDVVVRSLRKKLGSQATMIETISGVGYRFRKG
jgi:hypothetical protein